MVQQLSLLDKMNKFLLGDNLHPVFFRRKYNLVFRSDVNLSIQNLVHFIKIITRDFKRKE
jgi:hypothetical protein